MIASVPAVRPPSQLETAAGDFLKSLSREARQKAVLPASSPELHNWLYVPAERKGVSWAEMDDKQQAAATRLLKSVLSSEGFSTVEAIRSLETVLRDMEKNPGRDPDKYWFLFFGEPNPETPWGWRYEGHHISLTFVVHHGKVVASTPQFLGSNPAVVKSDPQKGVRELNLVKFTALRLMKDLPADQLKQAVIDGEAPRDIVTSTSRKALIDDRRGLPITEMKGDQQLVFGRLLHHLASVQSPVESLRRQKAIDLKKVVFAWMGPVSGTGRHYFRIIGEDFVIEYDNTQDDGNHIHTVWRSLKEDFGGDTLADHYAHDHRH